MNLRDLPDLSDALKQVQMYEKKKLDPVGKEDGDIDNDGDKDKTDSYLLNRRKTVTKAMGKKTHLCASKVKMEDREYDVIPEAHTLLEDGTVTHYDITDGNFIMENVPVEELEIIKEGPHEHFVNYDKNLEVLGETCGGSHDGDMKKKKKKKEEMGEGYGSKKKKKHDCASKVKHEEFGVGNCIKGMHDLDENGVVQHYDVFFEHGIEKHVPVSKLEILEGGMHEHVIHDEAEDDA
tara:strand:+ start:1879 stop:2586 length:708 start_codon:yes stop_codon:yes gene_type:complete